MPILAESFGAWEIILVLALILIYFGAKDLPKLGEGLMRFRRRTDQEAHDAGESLGGIYGKVAAEALTPDNQTAELYDPAVFHHEEKTGRVPKRMRFRGWLRLWRSIWHSVLKRLRAKI